MTVNDPAIFNDKFKLLNALAEKSLPHCNYVSVNSSLIGAMDDLHDEQTIMQKVLGVLENEMNASVAKHLLDRMLAAGIRFREKE